MDSRPLLMIDNGRVDQMYDRMFPSQDMQDTKWTLGWTLGWTIGWTLGWMREWTLGWIRGWTLEWMPGWTQGWTLVWTTMMIMVTTEELFEGIETQNQEWVHGRIQGNSCQSTDPTGIHRLRLTQQPTRFHLGPLHSMMNFPQLSHLRAVAVKRSLQEVTLPLLLHRLPSLRWHM